MGAGAEAVSKWFGPPPEAADDDNEGMFSRFTIDQAKKYGEGGYGATFAAQDTLHGVPAAVKVIDTRRMRLESIRKECAILEGLHKNEGHENVIKVLGHGTGKKSGAVAPVLHLHGGGEWRRA